MSDRTYEEDVEHWVGDIDAPGTDPLLAHLTDQEICGLGDSYDDGRIDTLTSAYIDLRQIYLKMLEAM